EQVGHPGKVSPYGISSDVLPEPDGQRRRQSRPTRNTLVGLPAGGLVLGSSHDVAPEDVAQEDHAMELIRNLHPDGLLSWNRGEDPDVCRGKSVSEVMLELCS